MYPLRLNTITRITVSVALLSLTACGGGGGGSAPLSGTPLPSGSLDASFGSGGVVTAELGSDFDDATALVVQPDGKVIVGGYTDAGASGYDFVAVRYDAMGVPDPGFGSNGVAKTDLKGPNYNDFGLAMALQADGKILQAGLSGPSGNANFAVARYLGGGSLDNVAPGFSGNGVVKTDIGGSEDRASAIGLQSNGGIVVAGWSNVAGNFDFALARYSTDGIRDLTFGTNGNVETDFTGFNDLGRSMAIQGDDKIVVVGNADEDIALVRYTADGELDPTFGPNLDGKVVTVLGLGSQANAVAIQSDGKIVIAGIVAGASINHGFDIIVARYLDNGSLDTAGFGFFGVAYHHIDIDDMANAVAIQADGKIVVAGSTDSALFGTQFLITRFNADGSLDAGFGNGGDVMPDFKQTSSASAVAIQPDGKIVAAGSTIGVGGDDFALVRINP